jgi:hypothetical protein
MYVFGFVVLLDEFSCLCVVLDMFVFAEAESRALWPAVVFIRDMEFSVNLK